ARSTSRPRPDTISANASRRAAISSTRPTKAPAVRGPAGGVGIGSVNKGAAEGLSKQNDPEALVPSLFTRPIPVAHDPTYRDGTFVPSIFTHRGRGATHGQ